MKNWFSVPKNLFTLLVIASVVAIAVGTYLGVALGMQVQASVTLLSAFGILVWAGAWGEFMALCLRLRKGESAFTPSTGRSLRIIGWCMIALAGITVLSAAIGGTRVNTAYWLVEFILLPGLFLAVYVVTKILRGLVTHAISLEEEQEGVV